MTTATAETMTPEQGRATIIRAVQYLSAQCDGARTIDGVGFNGLDAQFGKSLAQRPPAAWTPRQVQAAHKMLRTYRKQLLNAGIDYDQIPVPTDGPAAESLKKIRTATLVGTEIKLAFGWEPPLIEDVKALPSRRFDKFPEPHWMVPTTTENMLAIGPILKKWGFTLGEGVPAAIKGTTEIAEKRLVASARTAADIDLSTLGLGRTPYPFQIAGSLYALDAKRTFIGDEMGLGKTGQALMTAQMAGAFPLLVICPASLKFNWWREATAWLPGRRVVIIDGSTPIYDLTADIYIVNFDVLTVRKKKGEPEPEPEPGEKKKVPLRPDLLRLQPLLKCLVVDEAQFIKGGNTLRTKAVKALAHGIEYRLLLTGTPVMNRPDELIPQLQVLGRLEDLGGWKSFMYNYCAGSPGKFGWEHGTPDPAALQKLNRAMRACCFIRRLKSEVLTELPPKTVSVVPIPLDNRAEYDRVEHELIQWLMERARADKAFLASLSGMDEAEKAERIAAHANDKAERAMRALALVKIEALKQVAAQGKLAAAIQWMDDFLSSGQKLIVFATHKDIVKAVVDRFRCPKITGDTSGAERDQAVQSFQNDPETRMIVLNMKAGGFGLTLTKSSNVVFLELGWNPGQHAQCEDRAHRIGQDDPVTAWYLLAKDTIDETIAGIIDSKRVVVDAATDGLLREDQEGGGVLDDLITKLTQGVAR